MTLTTRLDTDLGLDRYDVLELVAAVEKVFELPIPDDCVSRLHTVGEIDRLLHPAGRAAPERTARTAALRRGRH